ncbi:MAG: YbjN domain-containing protein [Myxococcota bacterium]
MGEPADTSPWSQLVLAMQALGLRAEFVDPDGPVVAETTPGLLGLVAWAHPDRGDVCVVETLVPSVPAARQRAVRDFVLRANHHLTAGTIDFDVDERRLNYRVGLHRVGTSDPVLVAVTIKECLKGMHRVLDPLLEVVEGTHATEAADDVYVPRGEPREGWIRDVAVLAEAMRALDLDVDVLEDNGMCQAILNTPDGIPALGCLAWVEPEHAQLCVTTMLPQGIPYHQLDQVAEFVLRVNHRFSTGAFDLDLDDGGLRHRVGLIYRPGGLTTDLAAVVVRQALERMKAAIDPLTMVFEGQPAKAAAETYDPFGDVDVN